MHPCTTRAAQTTASFRAANTSKVSYTRALCIYKISSKISSTHLQKHRAVVEFVSEQSANERLLGDERADEDDVRDVMTLGAEVDLRGELFDHE